MLKIPNATRKETATVRTVSNPNVGVNTKIARTARAAVSMSTKSVLFMDFSSDYFYIFLDKIFKSGNLTIRNVDLPLHYCLTVNDDYYLS